MEVDQETEICGFLRQYDRDEVPLARIAELVGVTLSEVEHVEHEVRAGRLSRTCSDLPLPEHIWGFLVAKERVGWPESRLNKPTKPRGLPRILEHLVDTAELVNLGFFDGVYDPATQNM